MTNTINVPHINKCACPTCRPNVIDEPLVLGAIISTDRMQYDLLGIYMNEYGVWCTCTQVFDKVSRKHRTGYFWTLNSWNRMHRRYMIEANDNDGI